MASIINAATSGGLVQSADTSGVLQLQSAGTTQFTVDSTGAYGTLERATAVTASGTSVDFTGIPSWVKRITVMFNGVGTNATSSLNLLIQIGSGAFTTSGYAGSAVTFVTTPAGVTSTAGFILTQSINNAAILHGACVINLITTNTYTATAVLNNSNSGQGHTSAGSVTLGGALDRIRITTVSPSTDTFDAGTINIMYEG